MASSFETRRFHNIRDIPLSALGGPPPTRATPVHLGLGRDNWDRTNIWQTTPTALEDISHEERQNVFSARDNKVITADVPKVVGGTSIGSGHNITAGSNKGLHVVSTSTTLSHRSMGPLSSPTRPRNNGVLGINNTEITMTSSSQSSLLSGSAPDIESSISSPSSSAFKGQRGSTIGRSFRHFNVEDAEEFVPSCLRGNERHPIRPGQFASNGILDYHEFPSGSTTNGSNNSHSVSSARIWDPSNNNYFPTRTVNNTRTALVHDRTNNRGMHPLVSGAAENASGHEFAAQSLSSSTSAQSIDGFRFDYCTENGCRPSNLRPDVASYHPTKSDIFELQRSRFDNGKYAYSSVTASRTENENDCSMPVNQYAAWANSNALNAESHNVPAAMYGNYSNSNSRQVSASSVPRFMASDPSNRGFAYRTGGISVLQDSRTKHPGETDSHRYGLSPVHNSYSVPQNTFAHDTSRLQPYQQPYGNGSGNNGSGYYNEQIQQPEYDPASTDVSEVLAEFRTYHRSRKYELKDIYGHIVEFSGDQNGSRFIQTKIEQANSDEKEQIFSELQTNARQLMADVFGNYVIQKMFDYGNQSQKKALASQMQGYMFALSTQAYGCRCVQKAFEHILTDQQAALVKELEGRAMEVVESQHGNHVIQKAIECIPGEHIQFIVDAHKNQVSRLAKHIYGCRIIQRMLEYCGPQVKRSVLDELHPEIPNLIADQYGNYVVQCIIKKCGPADRYPVIECIKQHVWQFSIHKFASNVVEKAIAYADDSQLREMVEKLVSSNDVEPVQNLTQRSMGSHDPEMVQMLAGPDGTILPPQSSLQRLLIDQYGNYVMQTVLRTLQGPRKRDLAQEIRRHLSFIPKNGRRHKQTIAMADLVNAIIAENSPSSTCTGPQTPRTPTSLNSTGSMGTPLMKSIEMVPSGFPIRDNQRDMLAFKPLHG